MPQRKQILWSQLKVGMLTIVSLTLLAIGIFLVTGEVGIFTKKMTLRTLTPDAGGIKSGAPVRLAGIDVGTVQKVGISGLPDPAKAVEIDMEINRKYASLLRSDSEAFLAAEGLLGDRFVNISRGTDQGTPVSSGAFIKFHPTSEFSQLVGGAGDLIDNLNVLVTKLNSIVGEVDSGQGSIGKLLKEDTLYRQLETTASELQKLVNGVANGKGSLGQLLASTEIYDHVNETITKLEAVVDNIQHGDGTVQRLMHDPGLYQKADQLIAQVNVAVDNINQGRGTIGKLAKDEELYHRLTTAAAGLNAIVASLQNGEGAAGRLLHDTTLYDNLNSTSVEVRELLADFRHNPKKFLTIHLKVF